MSQNESINNKTYIKAIKELQLLFAREYRNGGWLPGGREMAQRMGISHSTYRKALARLEQESFVRSYPCKGHYVVANHERCHKVGLILRDGSESPFFEECANLMACIKLLHDKGFEVQLIQCTRPEQLHDNAIAYGVDGLIWFKPSDAAAIYAQEITVSGDIPLVVVDWSVQKEGRVLAHCVTKDYQELAEIQVKNMQRRGHSRVLLVGYAREIWTKNVLACLMAAGIKTEFCESSRDADVEDLHELLLSFKPTGVISCSGSCTTRLVFGMLAQIPPGERPELLLSEAEVNKRDALVETGVEFMMIEEECLLGEAAAKLLIDHLTADKPMTSVKVGCAGNALTFYRQVK